jgi:hypothetical protein
MQNLSGCPDTVIFRFCLLMRLALMADSFLLFGRKNENESEGIFELLMLQFCKVSYIGY